MVEEQALPIQGPCNCPLLVRFLLPCKHLLRKAYSEGFPIPLSLFHPRWWIDDVSTPYTFTPRYWSDTIDPDSKDPTAFRDQGKNKFLANMQALNNLHQTLPKEQADKLAHQLATFQVNVTEAHAIIQKNLQGIPTELPPIPPTKKAQWAELKAKKAHDKAAARAMTAAEINNRETNQLEQAKAQEQAVLSSRSKLLREEAKRQLENEYQARANEDDILLYETDTFSLSPRPKNQHPAPSSMSSKPKLPPGWIYATESQETALSTRTNELPPSSASLPTTKNGRIRKEKKAWEQAKGNSQPKRRPRGPTLEETLVEMQSIPAPKKTKAKAKAKEQDIYTPAENIDERESQQQRILAAAYMVDGGGAEEAEQADSELI